MQHYLDSFISYLSKEKRYSKHTVNAYRKDIEQFNSFLSTQMEVVDLFFIKNIHVRSWIVTMVEDGIANRSINRKIVTLRNFYKFLRKSNIELRNPCDKIQALKTPKRLPSFVQEKDLRNTFELIVQDTSDPFQWRDYVIVELLYNTGLRRSELINLQKSDISFNRNVMRVMGKGGKERLVPLSDTLISDLKKYLDILNERGYLSDKVFITESSKKLYPKAVYNIVKKYLSLLTTVEKKSPHVLRHSFATHLMNRGAELNAVKEILGHSSLAATQVYTHNSIEELKSIYKKAHPKS
jgi:integrase/recombinase XerC